MSTDADRICTHVPGAACERCWRLQERDWEADLAKGRWRKPVEEMRARIAQLTAELERVRKRNEALWSTIAEERATIHPLRDALDAERDAHERTKAALVEANRLLERECSLSMNTTNAMLKAQSERDAASARDQAAQAEAAAMREVIERQLRYCPFCHPKRTRCRAYGHDRFREVIDGTAGHALAERVTLLEAVATAAIEARDNDWRPGRWFSAIRVALASLAPSTRKERPMESNDWCDECGEPRGHTLACSKWKRSSELDAAHNSLAAMTETYEATKAKLGRAVAALRKTRKALADAYPLPLIAPNYFREARALADAVLADADSAAAGEACRGIYTASRTRHAHRWRALRDAGVPVISTWIDEAGEGESASLSDLWIRCVREAKNAKAVIVYAEEGDVLKGAFVEAGAALAAGVPVYVVGPVPGSWVNHPLATKCESVDAALAKVAARRGAGSACAGCAKVARHPGEGYACVVHDARRGQVKPNHACTCGPAGSPPRHCDAHNRGDGR